MLTVQGTSTGGAHSRGRSGLRISFIAAAICLGVFSAGVIGYARAKGQARAAQPSAEAPESADDGETKRQLAELRGELAALRLTAARNGTPAAPPSADEAQPAESREAAPPAAKGPPPDPEADFRAEPIDSGWASSASARVSTAFKADNVKAVVRNMECRSRSCRVEVEDPDIRNPVFFRVNEHLSAEFPNAIEVDSVVGDRRVSTLYFLRSNSDAH
jgi:hypothetical protein